MSTVPHLIYKMRAMASPRFNIGSHIDMIGFRPSSFIEYILPFGRYLPTSLERLRLLGAPAASFSMRIYRWTAASTISRVIFNALHFKQLRLLLLLLSLSISPNYTAPLFTLIKMEKMVIRPFTFISLAWTAKIFRGPYI